jgi:hypothetical protein
MIAPAAYVLPVPEERREILLDPEQPYYSHTERSVAEPVPWFDHSRRAPLIVFGCFEDGAITHIADGRKGASAGTGLVRLNMTSLEPLAKPVTFAALLNQAPARLRAPVRRTLVGGGKLPPKSLGAVIDALLGLEPSLSTRLERFSDRRADLLRQLSDTGRTNLAVQKETLTVALEIAGIETEEVLEWSPVDGTTQFFLEGMPQAVNREDAMLISDFSDVPGFEAIRQLPFAARVFQSSRNPEVRLKVLMANRLPLEQQTGADLIYCNEAFRSFVMIEYKAMDHGDHGPEFRWRPEDQLSMEIARMDDLLNALHAVPVDNAPASFRLHTNPFFLKLCPRIDFNPDDKGSFKGMYLPLDFWKSLANDPVTEGPRGGRLITYANVGRRLTNSEFVSLVASAWVGTTVPQSVVLERVIENVIQSGKTVTFAVKSLPPAEQHDQTLETGEDLDFDDLVNE